MLHSPGKIKHTHKQINVKDAAEGQYEAFNTHRCYMRLNDDESVAAASGYTRCYQPCYCRYPCVILCAGPPLPWRRNHPISSNSGRIHFTSYDTSRQQRVSTDDWDAPRDSFFFSSCFVDSLPSPPPTLKFPCPFLALIHSYSLNPDWTHVGVAHVIASVETDAADAGRRPNVVEPVEAVRVVSFSAISSHPPDPPRFPPPQPLPAIMTNEYNRILSYYYSNPITEQLRQQQQQHKRRSRRRKNNKCKKQIIIELGRI